MTTSQVEAGATAAADAGDEDAVRRRGAERAQHQPDRRELSTTQLLPA